MDIKDYAQMMRYLTRPRDVVPDPSAMDQEPRIPFARGSIKATRDYLDSLEKGATINRKDILKKFKVDNSVLTKIFKAYEDKNFNFEKSPSILKGVIINQPTERQSYLGEYLYNKDWKNLTDQERTNIVNKGYNENTITDYRKSVIDKPLIQKAKDLGYKTNFKDMGYEHVRRVKAGLPPGNRLMNNKEKIRVDKEMLKLADDPRMVEIIERGTPNKNDLLIVKEILGDVNAPNKLNQFVSAFSGDRPVDGITLKFKDNAKNILDKMPYTNYQRAMDETQAGRQFGENSLSVIKKDIKKSPLYQDTGLSKFTNIDEANAITGNSRRGTSPYGIFGQIIDKEKNSGTKMSWDGRKSTLEKQLQEAIATGNKTKINQAVIKFNKAATKAEGTLNMQKLRGAKRIRLPRVSLDDPSKTIANWSKFNDKYKDVFNKNFVERKYSFVIPKDLRTIPELRKDVLNPKSPVYKEMINTLKQGFNEFDEKKLFKKMNNATPEIIKKIIKKIPRLASVDSNFETNMFASANNIMSDATYVDETEPDFAKRNPVVSGTAAATAGTAGVLKATKTPIKKALGTIFKAGGLPMSMAFNAIYGIDPTSSVDRAILAGEVALAPGMVKDAISVTDKIKNPLLKKAAQFVTTINPKMALRATRFATPVGLGLLAAEGAYTLGKKGYERKQLLDSLTDEQKTNLFRQEQSDVVKQQLRGDQNAFDEFSAAEGGIANLMKKYYD
jgi:hypothetical protein